MTTIAYRDGVMASDGRAVIGKMVTNSRLPKIFRLRNGSLLGMAGSVAYYDDIIDFLETNFQTSNHLHNAKFKGVEGIWVSPDGDQMFSCENGHWTEQEEYPYYAVGSGSPYAYAAMDFGASAREAVKIAIGRDIHSGGTIRTLSL